MNISKSITRSAGVDVSKPWLDAALHGCEATLRVTNTPAGHGELVDWLLARGVLRVGLEATGGYERALVKAVCDSGLELVVHQPIEIKLFARLKRLRAKNDRIDAKLIASATAQVDTIKAAADPRLVELAERLTAYEQATDLATLLKTQMEHMSLPDLVAEARAQLAILVTRKTRMIADIMARIRLWPDLAHRLGLLRSLPGVGPIVALSLLIRMPELGSMRRGQASALIGVAPFDRDSGERKGQRFIAGGRRRPRKLLYLAALTAKRCDPCYGVFAKRLIAAGKPPKVAIVAIMRKLIEAANLILQRDRPWQQAPQ
ncbi:IS110 family transposase [Rhizobium sp. AC27/96]|uniref:IS110 family transposase n=1 Tax=Rhizobium sp. AC27/96 TaxID=1841653 RepID=UPI0009F45244|nr:IS110 family transposase [Rhizobium sp. AC27/96]